MHLEKIEIKNHPILKDLNISFLNVRNNKPYPVVVFVGENGCGKTTLLNELFNYSSSQYVVRKKTFLSFADNGRRVKTATLPANVSDKFFIITNF